jgi:cytochrome b561
MAVQVARSQNSLARAHSRERMHEAFLVLIGLVAVIIGVVGLLGASSPRQLLESWINIHVLFGVLLCAVGSVRYRWYVGHSPVDDVGGVSRHLSRIIYLLLYLVVGVREMVSLFSRVTHGGAVDFDLFADPLRNGPDHMGWNPKDDFQLFIASGLLALVFVRVLAFSLGRRTASALRSSRSKAVAPAAGIRCTPPRLELRSRYRSRRA